MDVVEGAEAGRQVRVHQEFHANTRCWLFNWSDRLANSRHASWGLFLRLLRFFAAIAFRGLVLRGKSGRKQGVVACGPVEWPRSGLAGLKSLSL